jgi:hypothetical protein
MGTSFTEKRADKNRKDDIETMLRPALCDDIGPAAIAEDPQALADFL